MDTLVTGCIFGKVKESRSLQERMCGLCELSLQKNRMGSVWEERGKWEKSAPWSGCPIYFESIPGCLL